jgi:D-3-phosphoglycerate dehydrogenase
VKIVVTEPIHPAGMRILEQAGEVVRPATLDPAGLRAVVSDADAVVVRITRFPAELIEAASRLKVIGRHGVGVDNVDLEACTRRGIPVVFTPEANAESVAENVLGCMITLAKRILPGDRALRAGQFAARNELFGMELAGKTIGIIGLGRIGRRVAQMCRAALDMHVIGLDPVISTDQAATLGIELAPDLRSLLSRADIVTLHVPLTPSTRGLLGAEQLQWMKPGAYLINTARGGIVDEQALYEALTAGRLAGAALDVFAEEPPSTDHPLFRLDNVIVTPHMAAHTEEAMYRMATMVAEEIVAVLEGKRPRWCANPVVYAVGPGA